MTGLHRAPKDLPKPPPDDPQWAADLKETQPWTGPAPEPAADPQAGDIDGLLPTEPTKNWLESVALNLKVAAALERSRLLLGPGWMISLPPGRQRSPRMLPDSALAEVAGQVLGASRAFWDGLESSRKAYIDRLVDLALLDGYGREFAVAGTAEGERQ